MTRELTQDERDELTPLLVSGNGPDRREAYHLCRRQLECSLGTAKVIVRRLMGELSPDRDESHGVARGDTIAIKSTDGSHRYGIAIALLPDRRVYVRMRDGEVGALPVPGRP